MYYELKPRNGSGKLYLLLRGIPKKAIFAFDYNNLYKVIVINTCLECTLYLLLTR